jgi:uncharacterized protein
MDEWLRPEELRVLGCLIEKSATTPDNYPLSSNALVNACNQSTNRDPVVSYSERQVDQVMMALREAGLARTVRGDGQRVHKHKHVVDEAWGLAAAPLAVLSVLMLRGAQTVNELRIRTERYGAGLDAETVESSLRAMALRPEPLVRLLARRPGEREPRWMHLLSGTAEQAEADEEAQPVIVAPTRVNVGNSDALAELRGRVDELSRRFETLLDRLGEKVD